MNINFPLVLLLLVSISAAALLANKVILSKQGGPNIISSPIKWISSFFPVLLCVFILRSFVFEPFQIPSGSMIPTLKIGDYILVNKFSYGLRFPVLGFKFFDVGSPKRGDVMVFLPPHDDRYFIKRVVGLPGDKIHILNNTIHVNGEIATYTPHFELPENSSYVVENENISGVSHTIQRKKLAGRLGENFSIEVPQGHYFMIGDNRDNSSDSRVWGAVPEGNIVGKAVLTWMHWKSLNSIPSFSRAGKIQ